jgi:hypothetical protein
MSGTFPTSPTPASIKISSIQPTLVSVAHSLKRQARSRGSQRWMMDIDYPPLSRADFAPVFAFAMAQQGQYGTFTFVPPIYGSTSGSATGTLLSNGAASAGDSTIAADGLTGTLKAGDFIKFAGHDKVYMLTADGSTSLTIEPPLLEAVANNEQIYYTNVPFKMAFAADVQEFSRGAQDLHDFSVSMVEVL